MKNKPKVAVIGLKGLPAFGGAATVGENIIEQLKKHYDFTVLSVSSHTSKINTELNGVKQVVFNKIGNGGLNTFIYYWKCLFYVLFHNFNLIHLHHAESGFITPFLKLKYKVIVTFHGIYNSNDPKFSGLHNWFFRFSERLNVKFADQVVSVSLPDSLYINNKYKRDILYIPNWINLNRDVLSLHINKKRSVYILFAAGRIYEIKGLHLLLEALKKSKLDIPLKIAGDINQVSQYRLYIDGLAKDLDITFLGLIKEKPQLMQLVTNARFFVFPSLTEAMSMMLLEVVSMKTPVIASDIPSNKAIFNDDEILFFRNNDYNDLSEKIKYAAANPDELEIMAEKAYKKLQTQYSAESISNKYYNLYRELLA